MMPPQNDAVRELAERLFRTAQFEKVHDVERIIRDAIRPLVAAGNDVLWELRDSSERKQALIVELARWKEPGR